MKLSRIALAVALAPSLSCAHAASTTETLKLTETLISANREAQPRNASSAANTVFNRQDIERLRTNAPGHRLRISVFGGQDSGRVLDAMHRPGHFHCNELYACLRGSQSTLTAVLRGGLTVPFDWPKWLENHFRWNPKTGVVKAMTEPVLATQCMQQLSNAPRPITNPDVLLFGLLVTGIGQSIAGLKTGNSNTCSIQSFFSGQ